MRPNNPNSFQSQAPQVLCELHPTHVITHICCLPACLTPLCSKCIKDHNQFHKIENTYSEIELVEDVKEYCGNKIRSSISNFTAEIERIQKYSKGNLSENDEGLKKIKKSKQLVLEIVNAFYQDLEDKYIKKVTTADSDTNHKDIFALNEKIKKIVEKMEKFYSSLDGKDFLFTIKTILLRDLDEEYRQIKQDISQEMGVSKYNPYAVQAEESKLKNIYQELENYISIKNIHEAMMTPRSKKSMMGAHNSAHERNDFQINVHDYFDPNVYKKYIHFFQHKSKNLHLLDLELVEQQNVIEFEKVELNIDFKIPRWHRSIVTPFSEIYLTGGVDVDNSDFKLNNAYVYDFNNKTLIEISSMNVGRSGHAIIYLNGYIYALGGFSEEKEFTDKCERYNIRKNVWEVIASMKFKSNNPCSCTFRGKYIYKFGGKIDDSQLCNLIERYNPLIDKWNVIEYEIPKEQEYSSDSFYILSSSACVQINHNQIFVFGGTYADYSQKSAQSYLLSIEEKDDERSIDLKRTNTNSEVTYSISHKIRGINEYPLPVPEGFWNNQVVTLNKKLYALQNVQNEKNNSVVYLDRRRVLEFDPIEGWKMLN